MGETLDILEISSILITTPRNIRVSMGADKEAHVHSSLEDTTASACEEVLQM